LKTSLSTAVTGQAIEALPTRNRDYLGLTLLMPATGEATVNGENGSGFAVGGAKGHEAALPVDGLPGYLTIGLCALPRRCRVSSIGRRGYWRSCFITCFNVSTSTQNESDRTRRD
jgi:hypothetical protein